MSNAVLEKIESLFDDPKNLSMEKVEGAVKEIVGFFDLLKLKISSQKEEEYDEALELAISLKEKLEAKAQSLCESIGIDAKTLDHYIDNPFNFSAEEWEKMHQTKESFEEYKKILEAPLAGPIAPPVPSVEEASKAKKRVKLTKTKA